MFYLMWKFPEDFFFNTMYSAQTETVDMKRL